jgi:hypothetical protein
MKDSIRTGISFGLTSAVITTLGLMVGLHSGTHSKIVVLAGILTIAIADAFICNDLRCAVDSISSIHCHCD